MRRLAVTVGLLFSTLLVAARAEGQVCSSIRLEVRELSTKVTPPTPCIRIVVAPSGCGDGIGTTVTNGCGSPLRVAGGFFSEAQRDGLLTAIPPGGSAWTFADTTKDPWLQNALRELHFTLTLDDKPVDVRIAYRAWNKAAAATAVARAPSPDAGTASVSPTVDSGGTDAASAGDSGSDAAAGSPVASASASSSTPGSSVLTTEGGTPAPSAARRGCVIGDIGAPSPSSFLAQASALLVVLGAWRRHGRSTTRA